VDLTKIQYLLDDTIFVAEPTYIVTIQVGTKIIKKLGAHTIIRDDLILACYRALKEKKIEDEQCNVLVETRNAETHTTEDLVSFMYKNDKLRTK